ncbi:unnamed protein product [Cuscuta campestris]|uniref:Poly(A) RNA polymerase mitochondrial-like central palm domain-containing protein n=1 Tax=Cuscuta campestris TaxID=132261 RepID=A0A484L900_9ASTE|nr:unnamed protein product [Cuscuta campestris]
MNENSPLEGTLHNILRLINPLEEDRSQRFQVIQGLRAIVQNIRSLKDATVEPYGSFVSDLFTKWGDIDVCVELGNACALTKKEKLTLLIDVLKELKSRGGYNRVKLISSARVPILMFRGKHNISCDLSINNIDGKIKSKLLYWISSIDGRFRDMVLLVCSL